MNVFQCIFSALLIQAALAGCASDVDVRVGHTYTVSNDSLRIRGEPCFLQAVDFLEWTTLMGVNLDKAKRFEFANAIWLHPGDRVKVVDFLGNIDEQHTVDPNQLGSKYELRLWDGRKCYAVNGDDGTPLFEQEVAGS